MKIVPGPEELARYREAGYKAAPVSCELLADICTPIQAVRKLNRLRRRKPGDATRSWAMIRS